LARHASRHGPRSRLCGQPERRLRVASGSRVFGFGLLLVRQIGAVNSSLTERPRRVKSSRCPRPPFAPWRRWTRPSGVHKHVLSLTLVVVLWPSSASTHDPSAWGGLFRSRDHGATWAPANQGRLVSAALALAISPTDVNHLLLGTDSGLLRS